MRIDSHHHFWQYDPIEYSWMNEKMGILKQNYGPNHLLEEITKSGIDGVISVQASQSIKETDDLLFHAQKHDFIKGVVGWFPLAELKVGTILERYAANPWLKGVRHVVQDETDDRFILGEDFNRGISLLKDFDLVYIIQKVRTKAWSDCIYSSRRVSTHHLPMMITGSFSRRLKGGNTNASQGFGHKSQSMGNNLYDLF